MTTRTPVPPLLTLTKDPRLGPFRSLGIVCLTVRLARVPPTDIAENPAEAVQHPRLRPPHVRNTNGVKLCPLVVEKSPGILHVLDGPASDFRSQRCIATR